MKIKRIEHVDVVVKDTEASRRLWEDCFGIKLGGAEANAIRKLALYPVGESMVELISGVEDPARRGVDDPVDHRRCEVPVIALVDGEISLLFILDDMLVEEFGRVRRRTADD